MKKFFFPVLILAAVILVVILNQQNKAEIEVKKTENNDVLKKELITSFKKFRDSIYQIKQVDLMAEIAKKTEPKQLNPDLCIKMAYDLQAFIMRTRLAPKGIEKSECQKINKTFVTISELNQPHKSKLPSYRKRLEKDLAYFTDEFNNQEWKKDDLVEKKREFDQKTAANVFKLKKKPSIKKISKIKPIKCLKTIQLHEKDFRNSCKKWLQ